MSQKNTDEENRELCELAYQDLGDLLKSQALAKPSVGNTTVTFTTTNEPGNLQLPAGYDALDGMMLLDIYEDESSGLYLYVVAKNDGKDISVICRGSEPPNENLDENGVDTDWVKSDVHKVDQAETPQMKALKAYLASQEFATIVDGTESITLAGHSLGADIAITGGMYLITQTVYGDKVEGIYAIDCPGASQDYLDAHMSQIRQCADRIHIYRYSGVGEILYDYPGVDYHRLKVKRTGGIIYQLFESHSLSEIRMNGDDFVFDTTAPSRALVIFGEMTRKVDELPVELVAP